MKAHLVFLDESGFLMAPLVRRGWRPRGQTPVLYQRTRSHQKVSAIAALCVAPDRNRIRLYFRLHPNTNINAGLVIEFLRHLVRQLDAPIVLVWDRLLAHRAGKVQAFIRENANLHADFFPPYAPELNPVENVWGYLKINPLSNRPFFDVDTLAQNTRSHGRSIQRKQWLLRSFIKHSPLSSCLK
ncbi:MAG: IS630 family transposase [Candidatus Binatia bacterium]